VLCLMQNFFGLQVSSSTCRTVNFAGKPNSQLCMKVRVAKESITPELWQPVENKVINSNVTD
jgi:hypothetical protein